MTVQNLKSVGLDFKRIPLDESVVIQPTNFYQPTIRSGIISDLDTNNPELFSKPFKRSLGQSYDLYVSEFAKTHHNIQITGKTDELLWLNYDEAELVENNQIVLEPYSKGTLVMTYLGDQMVHHGNTRILIHEGAELTLIKLQANGYQGTYVDQNLIEIGDNASLKVIDIQMGSNKMIVNYDANLVGYKSKCDFKSIYMATENRGIDISFTANHMGKKSESKILGKGVLSGYARKVFRGTLSFEDGSAQSVGKEEELVLLLSEHVKADSIPALMCAEDDVIGEHGASIGQLDEEQLFYLMSRGLPEHQAKLLVVSSGFKEILEEIKDVNVKKMALEILDRRIEDVI